MTAQSRTVLKSYFQRGLRPTQSNYGDLIDSFFLVSGDSFDNPIINNPTVSGGTFAAGVFNTPTVSAGTFAAGTFNNPIINTPTVSAGTFASPTLTGIPIAPTAVVGTNTTQIATTAYVMAQGASYKVGSLTRNTATASGNVAYTGVGFQPRSIIFLAVISSTSEMSIGVNDGTTSGCVTDTNATTPTTYAATTGPIYLDQGATGNTIGGLLSFDSDGFTLTWTKNASPTGTATVYYLALR